MENLESNSNFSVDFNEIIRCQPSWRAFMACSRINEEIEMQKSMSKNQNDSRNFKGRDVLHSSRYFEQNILSTQKNLLLTLPEEQSNDSKDNKDDEKNEATVNSAEDEKKSDSKKEEEEIRLYVCDFHDRFELSRYNKHRNATYFDDKETAVVHVIEEMHKYQVGEKTGNLMYQRPLFITYCIDISDLYHLKTRQRFENAIHDLESVALEMKKTKIGSGIEGLFIVFTHNDELNNLLLKFGAPMKFDSIIDDPSDINELQLYAKKVAFKAARCEHNYVKCAFVNAMNEKEMKQTVIEIARAACVVYHPFRKAISCWLALEDIWS